MIRVALPFPDKILWPNGRTRSHMAKARAVKRHRAWADIAALEAAQKGGIHADTQGPIPVLLIVHAKRMGPLPDKDNCVAAAKAYLDGIAQRLGVNDRCFAAPTVEFAAPRDGRFVIEIGDAAE